MGQPNNDLLSINPTVRMVLTILAVVIMLGGLWFLATRNRQAVSASPTEAAMTEAWPTPRVAAPTPTSTFTPGPTLGPLPTPTATATVTPSPTPTPIVIGSFEELGTLVSVRYTLQTVVQAQRERVFPLPPERIILAAVGNVEAGVDLTQVQDDDIIVQGTSVTVTLPSAQVTSVELLPGESEIFDSRRGWLLSEYDGLELEAMDTARTQLEDWAVKRIDVLDQAERAAQTQLELFLRRLGFEEVTITFRR